MRRLNMRFADDRGAVAVIVAVLLVVFLGFAALVVDMGYAYSVRRQLQAAADAGALAGCQELILKSSEARILEVAGEYATRNSNAPGDGLQVVSGPPHTEVGSNYVKVTVEKPMSLFFGRIFTSQPRMIRAQAKARIAYLTGMRGIAPWAVPILRATRVEATLDGVTRQLTWDPSAGAWTGNLPVPATAQNSGYPVTVIAYNGQTAYPDGTTDSEYHPHGVKEIVDPAASVAVLPSTSPIKDVSLSRYYAVSGLHTSVTLTVRADKEPTARFNGKSYKLKQVSLGVYQVALTVPSPPDLLTLLPIDIEVGSGNDKVTVTSAAVLVVRRSTYPISDVSLERYVFQPGGVGFVRVSVKLTSYVYGNQYELKVVGGGAEVGNFGALDLSTIKHTPNWRHPQHPSEYPESKDGYYDYLRKPFPHVVHLGDTIWTEPGNLSGSKTESALNDRFKGNTMTFAAWEAAGKPSSSRIVYVPITEKVQSTTGRTPLRVISFGAFYIEPGSDLAKDTIKGRFIEYLSPSDDLSETPPEGLYIMTPRLVSDGIY